MMRKPNSWFRALSHNSRKCRQFSWPLAILWSHRVKRCAISEFFWTRNCQWASMRTESVGYPSRIFDSWVASGEAWMRVLAPFSHQPSFHPELMIAFPFSLVLRERSLTSWIEWFVLLSVWTNVEGTENHLMMPGGNIFALRLITWVHSALVHKRPQFLAEWLKPVVSQHNLRSHDLEHLQIPRTRTELGKRDFRVAALQLWNATPLAIRSSPSGVFHDRLMKHLYCLWTHWCVLWFACMFFLLLCLSFSVLCQRLEMA